MIEITVKGELKEDTALVLLVQERQLVSLDEKLRKNNEELIRQFRQFLQSSKSSNEQ